MQSSFIRRGLIAVSLLATTSAFAQTPTIVHTFTGPPLDGNYPLSPLVRGSDDRIYGVTFGGGASNVGTLFRVEPDGTGYSVLFSFPASLATGPSYGFMQGRDGALYGTSFGGGANRAGALFRVNTDGSGFSVVHAFGANDGNSPRAGLVHATDGFIYGTTQGGSGNANPGAGTIYRVAPDGSGYRVIFTFEGVAPFRNGAEPEHLIQGRDGNLYGITAKGPTDAFNGPTRPGGSATIFTVKTDGTGFATLRTGSFGNATGSGTIYAPLLQGIDGYLYGVLEFDGQFGRGSIFRMRTDGTDYQTVYSFNTLSGGRAGPDPRAFFQASDGSLYGRVRVETTVSGRFGVYDFIYKIQPNGTGLRLLGTTASLGNGGHQGHPQLVQGRDGAIFGSYGSRVGGGGTELIFRLVEPPGLGIQQQPLSQTVALGGSVTFTVAAAGATSFQWRRNGIAIAGATGASYTLNNLAAANAGTYSVITADSTTSVTSADAVLALAPLSTVARLSNLSILTSLAGANDSFTMGYVVGGAGTSGTKALVMRAVGPSLTPLGVGGALADPKLETFAGATKTGENDNWGGGTPLFNAMEAVGAFRFTGASSADAAIATSVALGDNSVKVTPVGNLSGAVIAEIYDGNPAASFSVATPRLVNVSVLKNIGTSLTAGFVIGGTGTRTLLIRAVGPTLGAAPFNVPGVVADPQLVLFNGASARIGDNDNWGGDAALTAAFNSVGAFALPAASRDAALLVTLQPGNYSVQVSGVGGTTGVAIVEVYEVP